MNLKFSPTVLLQGGITARALTKFQKTSIDSSYYISEILVQPAFSRATTSTVNCFQATAMGGFSRTVLVHTYQRP